MASVDIVARLKLSAQQFVAEQEKTFGGFEARANKAAKFAGGVMAKIGAGTGILSVAGIAAAGKQAFDYASSLGEVSQQLGVTAKDLQVYRFAAGQAGVSQEEMDKSLAKLTQTVGKAATGGKEQAKVFKALGIDVRGTNGEIKTAGDLMPQLADALSKVHSPAERAAVLVELFGKSGQKLETLLSGGSGQIDQLRDAAERLGIVISDRAIATADETADKLAAIKTVLSANIARTVVENSNAILGLANSFTAAATGLAGWWAQNPEKAMGIVGAYAGVSVGARFGVPGAIAGGALGAFAGSEFGRGQAQSVADGNMDVNFRRAQLLRARAANLRALPNDDGSLVRVRSGNEATQREAAGELRKQIDLLRRALATPAGTATRTNLGGAGGGLDLSGLNAGAGGAADKPKRISPGEALERAQRGDLYSSAASFRGRSERGDNAVLRDLFKEAGQNVDPKITAWCAAFVNAVLATEGLPGTGKLNARSFLGYGSGTSDPEKGDIVVSRRGKNAAEGHVGFFEGFDKQGNVRVLGGNTGDKVGSMTVNKRDVLGFRRAPDAADAYAATAKADDQRAEEAAKALADAQKRVTEALGASNEELTLAIQLGEMRALGMERQAEVEEAIARLRAQMLPLIAEQAKGDAAGAAAAREQLVIQERLTEERVRQGHAVEDNATADKAIEDRRKKKADAAEEAAQYAQRTWEEQAERQRESVSDLADFFEDAFDSGGKSIWSSFKDQGKRVLAEMAAQWALSLISGQQASLPSILGQINAPGGGGGNFVSQALGSLLGGRAGGGGGLDAAINATAARNNIALGGVGPIGGSVGGGGAAGAGGGLSGLAGSAASAVPQAAIIMAATTAVSSLLGIKNNAGGAFGVLGNVVFGAFQSAKRGSATLGFDGYGDLGVTSTRGNSASRREAASSSLGGVGDTLSRIAEQLGGSIGGTPSVSLGVRDKNFRVDPTGKGRTKGKGVLDFGKDEEAAIRAAISEALRDGVVQGISDASKRILQSGQELERAIDKAAMIEDIPRRLKARLDPVGAAIDDLNKGWDKAIAALREGGASTEQMADAQRLYKMELEDTKASAGEASASLKAFRDSLNAGSASPLSLRDQERAAEAALKPFLDQITAGERIDQGRYQEAAQAYLEIERQLNGSGAAYFAAFDRIQDATGRAIATIDNATPIRPATDPFAQETASNTRATADINDQMNGRLANLEGLMGQLVGLVRGGGGDQFIGATRNFVNAA